VLKGPVAQKLIHGDFFSKPSFDVDLLVLPDEYDLASQIIADNGFALARECSSPWWSMFLGEQHFVSSGLLRSTLDLHYRTQQPGSPGPREGGRFISQSVGVWVGGTQIYTLSRTNSCLLSCMSLSKALMHREPAGSYVSDIATFFIGHRTDELQRLFEEASSQGLRNTLALGLRSAHLLFGIEVGLEKRNERRILKSASDADLMMMILTPHSPEIRWPRRSKMLWDLCDHKAAYPRAICWKIAGDLCRQLYRNRSRSLVSNVAPWIGRTAIGEYHSPRLLCAASPGQCPKSSTTRRRNGGHVHAELRRRGVTLAAVGIPRPSSAIASAQRLVVSSPVSGSSATLKPRGLSPRCHISRIVV